MRHVVRITVDEVAVDPMNVLESMGLPPTAASSDRISELARQAADRFRACAVPSGVLVEVSRAEFNDVYQGEGQNPAETPLPGIAGQSDRLALFAVTVGPTVSRHIAELFHEHDFALATALDAAASEAAERCGDLMEDRWLATLQAHGEATTRTKMLRYSPGYCGWHVSGQKKLFARLHPEEIGITLRDSFLMEPLKSMSGVIVAGSGEIHDFENTYDFCHDCATWGCRERIERVLGHRA